ncbi:MAG: Group intron-encoded protein LtrA [Verrucomicrobiota bacterium]
MPMPKLPVVSGKRCRKALGKLGFEEVRQHGIHERKHRRVAAAPFRERVVHHALVRVLEAIFEKKFIEDSYACRKGKGTHAGVRRCAEFARRFPYVRYVDDFLKKSGLRRLTFAFHWHLGEATTLLEAVAWTAAACRSPRWGTVTLAFPPILMREGFSLEYGARNLERVMDEMLGTWMVE